MTRGPEMISLRVLVIVGGLAALANAQQISSISPNRIRAGSSGFTLTVNGSGFAQTCSTVYWNNQPLPTSFRNASLLLADVSAALIASPGSATVNVFGPAPVTSAACTSQGAFSNSVTFAIPSAAQITSGLSIVTQTISPSRAGLPYAQLLQAAGGSGALVWSIVGAAPSGIGIDSVNGVLLGTPGLAGEFHLTVQVRDGSGASASRSYVLTVVAGLQFISEEIPSATVGAAFSFTFRVTGGVTPYRFSELSFVPPGLSFDVSGILSGTPTQSGTFLMTVQVTDAAGASLARDFTMTVGDAFRITTETLMSGTVGANYNQTVQASGGRLPLVWTLVSGGLPPGVALNSNGGITGIPTQAGTFTFTVAVTDASAQRLTKQLSITIRGGFAITTGTLPNGTVGTAYSQTLGSTGGVAPVQWSVSSGTLPAGITLGAATGVLSGTPSAEGQFRFEMEARDAANQSARQTYVVPILAALKVTTTSLAAGTVNAAYRATLDASGGEAPYAWTVSVGSLPAGLTLGSPTGVISGTPTTPGATSFTVRVTDAGGRTAAQALSISVAAAPAPITITTSGLAGAMVAVSYSQTLAATGGSGGLTWSLSVGALPDGLTMSSGGVIGGTPSRNGTFNFTVAARDAQTNAASKQLSIQVAALSLGTATISLGGQQPGPGDQPAVSFQLAAATPAAITGTLSLSFQSDVGVTDPALRFSQANPAFTIAAGQQQAVFPGGLNLQLGTVAGVVTITARLAAAGVDVTPNPAPTQTIRVNRAAPVIKTINTTRNGNTLTIEIVGFSTSREIVSADVQFAARAGATVQATSFTVQLGTAFGGWYKTDASDQSRQFGSNFTLTMPFTVSGDASVISGVTLTLLNSVGRSAAASGNF